MNETDSRVDCLLNLRRAAGFDAEMTSPYLFQILGYRKHAAEQLLKETDEQKAKDLEEVLEYSNQKIKQILGL